MDCTNPIKLNHFLIQETVEDIDKNGDGKINLEEYIGRLLVSPPTNYILCAKPGSDLC